MQIKNLLEMSVIALLKVFCGELPFSFYAQYNQLNGGILETRLLRTVGEVPRFNRTIKYYDFD